MIGELLDAGLLHPDVRTVVGDGLQAYRDRPVNNDLLREVTDLLMTRVRGQLAGIRDEPEPAEFYVPSKAARKDTSADEA